MAITTPPAKVDVEGSVQSGVFTPPAIGPGDSVRFRLEGRHDWSPALVQRVNGDGRLDLLVMPYGVHAKPYHAVQHVNDPGLSEHRRRNFGMWDVTEQDRERRQTLAALSEALRDVHQQLAKAKKT